MNTETTSLENRMNKPNATNRISDSWWFGDDCFEFADVLAIAAEKGEKVERVVEDGVLMLIVGGEDAYVNGDDKPEPLTDFDCDEMMTYEPERLTPSEASRIRHERTKF